MLAGQRIEALSTLFGLTASLTLHAMAFAVIFSAAAPYDFDFKLTLPTEVEFGLTEGMSGATPPATILPPPPLDGDPRKGNPIDQVETVPDAGVPLDAEHEPNEEATDGGRPEPTPKTEREPRPADATSDAQEPREEEQVSAAEPSFAVAPPTVDGPSRIPPGAQRALRMDMKRVRESPRAPDVTRFLEGVPDWRLILNGSGIDPVEDLDRLLVASPNLERSKLVIAGRHRHEPRFARTSASRLAKSRGKGVRWTKRFGVTTARWHNLDRTNRTLALLGPQHFSITRRQDLQRVLAMAKARELRDPENEGLVAARGPEALLSMGPEEALSLEVEGVHRFVVGSVRHVPLRLRVAVRETGTDQATVNVLATYASDADATAAAAYWRNVADFYAGQLWLTLAGFGRTIRGMQLDAQTDRVRVSLTLNADQIRFILSYLEGRLRGFQAEPSARRRPEADETTTKKGP